MSQQTVVITGASSGIGFALAEAFLKRGDNVVGNARTSERLAEAAQKLGNPKSFLGVAGDIALPDTTKRLFDTALEQFGRVDILINNAGIFIAKPVQMYTANDLDSLLATNLKGFFFPAQRAAELMSNQRSGHIINITASLGVQPLRKVPSLLPVMVKGGLNAATQSLALELADKNVQVNAVAPGVIETPLHSGGDGVFLRSLSPAGRTGSTDDVVDAVLYLVDAKFTSGVVLPVDGGSTAGVW